MLQPKVLDLHRLPAAGDRRCQRWHLYRCCERCCLRCSCVATLPYPSHQLIEVRVDYRRHVQRDQLRERQSAHHGNSQRTPRFRTGTGAKRNRQRANQRCHRRHRDGAEAHPMWCVPTHIPAAIIGCPTPPEPRCLLRTCATSSQRPRAADTPSSANLAAVGWRACSWPKNGSGPEGRDQGAPARDCSAGVAGTVQARDPARRAAQASAHRPTALGGRVERSAVLHDAVRGGESLRVRLEPMRSRRALRRLRR